jgi:hypothetical protein
MNFSILAWLRGQGHEVTVLLVGDRLPAPVVRFRAARVAGPRVRAVKQFVLGVSVRAVARGLGVRRRGDAAVLGAFTAEADVAWCRRWFQAARPDAVFVDTIFRAPVLDGVRRGILIAHDVVCARVESLVAAGFRVRPEVSREAEAGWLGRADDVAAISAEDAAVFKGMGAGRVFVLPMPAPPCPAPAGGARLPGRLVFVGSDAPHNVDGMRWFLREVWPHLTGVTLDIVGDCGAALGRLPAGVVARGRHERLGRFLHRAALAISPLRAGSGLKLKMLDYARHGLWTVATPVSLAGFPPEGAPFWAAGDAAGFAAAVQAGLSAVPDEAAALAYVARHFGEDACFGPLAAVLDDIKAS